MLKIIYTSLINSLNKKVYRLIPCELYRLFFYLLSILFLTAYGTALFAAITIQSIKADQADKQYKVIINLSGKPTYRWFALNNPDRLVVDINNADYRNISRPPRHHSFVKRIRWAEKGAKSVRFVFELAPEIHSAMNLVRDQRKGTYKLQAVFSKKPYQQRNKSTVSAITLPKADRDVIVMVDPGHGGKDPGAIGYRRYQEKNVTLPIAKKLVKLLNQEEGVKAFLTRRNDTFISLRRRTEIARKKRADIFISIHANSLRTRRTRGAMVFMLSKRGATSMLGRWLEHKENREYLIGGTDGIRLSNKSDRLTQVLLDLSMSRTNAHSTVLSQTVLSAFKSSSIVLHSGRIEKASFIVLKSPDIPSILVETGFLTTPSDARLLVSSLYQLRFAEALEKGVLAYFRKNPPVGSWIAGQQKNNIKALNYRVKRGDTLSGIAGHFGMSVSALTALNGLKMNSTLHTGRLLKIHAHHIYKIRAGDTLTRIASRFYVSLKELSRLNNLNNKSRLITGRELKIPY